MDVKKRKKMTKLRCPLIQRDFKTPITREGWLNKLSRLKTWKKRWFVLSNYCLFYYKDSDEQDLLGSILIPSYQIKPWNDITQKYAFKAGHQNMKSFYLAAEHLESMKLWMNDLSLASIMFTSNSPNSKLPIKIKSQQHCNNFQASSVNKYNMYSDEPFGAYSSKESYFWTGQHNNLSHVQNSPNKQYNISKFEATHHNSSHHYHTNHENLYKSNHVYNFNQSLPEEINKGTENKYNDSKMNLSIDYNPDKSLSYANSIDSNKECMIDDLRMKAHQPLYANAPPKPKRSQDFVIDEGVYKQIVMSLENLDEISRPQSADFLEKQSQNEQLRYSMDDLCSKSPKQDSMKQLSEWRQRMLQTFNKSASNNQASSKLINQHHSKALQDFQEYQTKLKNQSFLDTKRHIIKDQADVMQAEYVNVSSLQMSSQKLDCSYSEEEDEEAYFKREDYYRASQMFYNKHTPVASKKKSSSVECTPKHNISWDLDKDVGVPIIPSKNNSSHKKAFSKEPLILSYSTPTSQYKSNSSSIKDKIKHFESCPSRFSKFNNKPPPHLDLSFSQSKLLLSESLTSSPKHSIESPRKCVADNKNSPALNKEEEAYISMGSINDEEPVYVTMGDTLDDNDEKLKMAYDESISFLNKFSLQNKKQINNLLNESDLKKLYHYDANVKPLVEPEIVPFNKNNTNNFNVPNPSISSLLKKDINYNYKNHHQKELNNFKKILNFSSQNLLPPDNLELKALPCETSLMSNPNFNISYSHFSPSKMEKHTTCKNVLTSLNIGKPDVVPLENPTLKGLYNSNKFKDLSSDEARLSTLQFNNDQAKNPTRTSYPSLLLEKHLFQKTNNSISSPLKDSSLNESYDISSQSEPCYENVQLKPENLHQTFESANEIDYTSDEYSIEPVYENILKDFNLGLSSPVNISTSKPNKEDLAKGQISTLEKEESYEITSQNVKEYAANISPGDLLGKNREELVLLSIYLSQNQSTLAKEIEFLENDDISKRENIEHLMELKEKFVMSQSLMSLVENMVKLGTLYVSETHKPTVQDKSVNESEVPSYLRDISDADEKMKRFYGILPREKSLEAKTVRIVKRESERRIKRDKKKDDCIEDSSKVSPTKKQDNIFKKRRYKTVAGISFESLPQLNDTRSRDDTDMERCLKSVNTPDIVQSTIKKFTLDYPFTDKPQQRIQNPKEN